MRQYEVSNYQIRRYECVRETAYGQHKHKMAKSTGYFGLRHGSTKSHTFQVVGGQQITKDRVEGGKNPRTLAQMLFFVLVISMFKQQNPMD